jgi:Nitrile hydratase beta subunit
LLIISPDSTGTACPLSGRNSTYRPVQISEAGSKPQHLYSIRFSARELWGEQAAPQDTVYIDMWDDYLESV